jgi:hypothetical protein
VDGVDQRDERKRKIWASSVDISIKDDVTVIFLLGFSFMPEPKFIAFYGS